MDTGLDLGVILLIYLWLAGTTGNGKEHRNYNLQYGLGSREGQRTCTRKLLGLGFRVYGLL